MIRTPYAESVRVLGERVAILGDALPEVTRRPRYDDTEPGPTILRLGVDDVELYGLTLQGLYVARSRLFRVSFKHCDLRLSVFNWSDLIECDFTNADLTNADLRACQFMNCNFSGAVLAGTDFQHSS